MGEKTKQWANTGILYPVKDKTNDKAPDAAGTISPICLDCGCVSEEVPIKAWKGKTKNGDPYLRLALEAADPATDQDEDPFF